MNSSLRLFLALGAMISFVSVTAARADSEFSGNFEPLEIRQIRNCSASQESVLREAERGLEQRISLVRSELRKNDLAAVYESFIVPQNREWQEGSPQNLKYENYLSAMDRVFGAMESDTRAGLAIECKDARWEKNCQGGEVYAYVLFWGDRPQKNLYLCTAFFALGLDQQKATLMHEVSHYSAATDDLAGSWMGGNSTDITQAPLDAYHIENFSDGDVAHELKRQIWFWNWPRRR